MKKMMRRTLSFVLALMMVLAVMPGASAAALKHGSKGTEVARLQKNLIGLGYLVGEADGSYGSITRTAVERFQTEFGLQADGSAGKATQTAVRNAVVRLQVELKKLGYQPGAADGSFGARTRAAVTAFQKDNGLPQTGTMNAAAWSIINTYTGGMRADISVRKGSYGTNVTYLQQALIGLGFLNGAADGRYGSMTEEGVRKFQAAYGLTVDGSAGRKTMTALKNAVVALQSDLEQMGYPSGTINGVYGNGTKSAVKSYQSACGIAVNGIAGPKTMEKIYGYSLGGVDTYAAKESYRVLVDPIYQTGDKSIIRYGVYKDHTTTVEESGCGGVSMAMALNTLLNTKRFTGQNVMQDYADRNYYWGQGSSHWGMDAYAQEKGLTTLQTGKVETVVSHLKQGHLVLALVKDGTGKGTFTKVGGGGHYILISGYRVENGVEQIFVDNPIKSRGNKWINLDELMPNAIIREGLKTPFIIVYK